MKKLFPWIVVIIVVVGLFYWSAALQRVPAGKYDEFAKCLNDKKFTMYGAYWCSHCKEEKARFGSSFTFVPYVECTESAELCKAKDVRGYPTWFDESSATNTQKYEGKLGLEKISEITSCPLPVEIK